MNVTCVPTKIVYSNPISGFQVLSCRPTFPYPRELKLHPVYHSFTISGTNLTLLKEGVEAYVNIEEDASSKYEASYVLVGYSGIEFKGEDLEITPDQELSFLRSMMTDGQAQNVHSAYPNFCKLVLSNRANEIDIKKIYGVGQHYFELYQKKILDNLKFIKFYPLCGKWHITDDTKIKRLGKLYTLEHLEQALDTNPYNVLCNILEIPFKKADKTVFEIKPDLRESLVRAEAGCLHILKQSEADGDTKCNANVMAHFVRELIPECKELIVEAVKKSLKIHYDTDTKDVALEKTYQAEKLIAKCIKDRIKKPFKDDMEWKKFSVVDGFECTAEQTEILKIANDESVAILTGNAGSGKSSSVKALILMLEHYGKSSLLLAPTGVAARRLRESTGREASTVHMFLASGGDKTCYDYVLIDEFSMVGVHLMADLLRVLPPHTKLIFVCDNAQLASISCGNLIQDILDSGIVKRANLTKVFRYDSSGLARIATDTRNGQEINTTLKFDDYVFIQANDDPVEQCKAEYEKLLTKYNKQDIMILCPYNKSNIGSYAINAEIQEHFNSQEFTGVEHKVDNVTVRFKIGDRVINKKNNYNMPILEYGDEGRVISKLSTFVANGDLGTIRGFGQEDNKSYLIVEFDAGLCKVEGTDIENLLLGYCISIHSSQGAQAKAVIVVIDKTHKNLLSRNLEYVAFSRAQEKMVVIADRGVVNEALGTEENMERNTYLKDLLLTNKREYDIMDEESEGD